MYDEYDISHQIYDEYGLNGDDQVMNTEQEYAQVWEEHTASPNEYNNRREVLEIEQG